MIEFKNGLYFNNGESYIDDFDKYSYYDQLKIFIEVLCKSRWVGCETIIAHNLFQEDDITFDVKNRTILYQEEDPDEIHFDFNLSNFIPEQREWPASQFNI